MNTPIQTYIESCNQYTIKKSKWWNNWALSSKVTDEELNQIIFLDSSHEKSVELQKYLNETYYIPDIIKQKYRRSAPNLRHDTVDFESLHYSSLPNEVVSNWLTQKNLNKTQKFLITTWESLPHTVITWDVLVKYWRTFLHSDSICVAEDEKTFLMSSHEDVLYFYQLK